MNAKTVLEFGFRMKNYADLGGCYLPRASKIPHIPSLISKILRIITQPH